MFHTLITLAYTIPGIYLFIRIWSLFIERRHRGVYILVFAFLYSLYPLSNLAGDDGSGMITRVLERITNYLLPFFLYLFLLLLFTDILMLINRLLKIVPKEKIKERRLKYRMLFTIILLSAVVVAGGTINLNTIRTTTYPIEIPKRNSDAGKLRIAFVSDLHLGDDVPVILLDHRPTDYEAIEKTGVDIVMSGHTHHGQLFPINLITGSIYELSYGYLRKGTTNFYVSGGLRLWGPPVRTVAKSEIVVVEVIFR